MTLIERDVESLVILRDRLLDLRHRLNTLGIVEKFIGDHIYGIMDDELGPIDGETLVKEWELHEHRIMQEKQCDMYLAWHERRIYKWLKRLQKGSSKKTK